MRVVGASRLVAGSTHLRSARAAFDAELSGRAAPHPGGRSGARPCGESPTRAADGAEPGATTSPGGGLPL